MQSAFYLGNVTHLRARPKRHFLAYSVFSMLIDLDELALLDKGGWIFGVNRRAILSFHEADHGKCETDHSLSLKKRIHALLAQAGYASEGFSISLLCYPRILGYVFNPLTVYYIKDRKGELRVIIYEVQNTFHESHTYLIPVETTRDGSVNQVTEKKMYVSPFTPLAGQYEFHMVAPAENVRVSVTLNDTQGKVLQAVFSGQRRAFSKWAALSMWGQYPLMTLKVTMAIHYEALKLFVKRMPLFRHRPAAEKNDVTITNRRAV